jgi:hypothetical protein
MIKTLCRVALIALLAWIALPYATRACDCMNAGAPCKAFANTQAIFAGRVLSITPPGERTFITFEVMQAYRGVTEKTVVMWAATSDCDYAFKEGVSYLVYAASNSPTERLHTEICTRTRPLADAKDDIDFLTHKDDPARASGIVGDVTMQYRDSQNRLQPASSSAGISVVISGVGVRKTVPTRKDGHFEIWGLEPGAYRVSPTFPDGFQKAAQTVKLAAQSCEDVHFIAVPPPKKTP